MGAPRCPKSTPPQNHGDGPTRSTGCPVLERSKTNPIRSSPPCLQPRQTRPCRTPARPLMLEGSVAPIQTGCPGQSATTTHYPCQAPTGSSRGSPVLGCRARRSAAGANLERPQTPATGLASSRSGQAPIRRSVFSGCRFRGQAVVLSRPRTAPDRTGPGPRRARPPMQRR